MATRTIQVERFSLVSSRSFGQVVGAIEEKLGRPDLKAFYQRLNAAASAQEYEQLVNETVSEYGLMEFLRLDLGASIRRDAALAPRNVMRIIAGNPLIMREMASRVPDAGSYAPVTILIDEREDGVHVSYDLMTSYLRPYGEAKALETAEDLDTKVISLLTASVG